MDLPPVRRGIRGVVGVGWTSKSSEMRKDFMAFCFR
jgi:hypothetical protein